MYLQDKIAQNKINVPLDPVVLQSVTLEILNEWIQITPSSNRTMEC